MKTLPWITVLAPMEGVGHPTFRHGIAAIGGLDLVCTEFVRVTADPMNPELVRRAIQPSPGAALSVQVMGNAPERMAEAAYYVSEAGAQVVDVNLGCPMPKIVKKGVGAALLKDKELLYRVLSEMRKATPGLFSAKIRAGFDDAGDVLQIARTVEAAGVDFISVHPRRRADFYAGVADWRIIKLLKQSLSIPVIGNGDLWYAADALRLQAETGCDALMIGRPVIRNPWIFLQIAQLRAGLTPFEPSRRDVVEYLELRASTYEDVFCHVKKNGVLGKLKELLNFISRGVQRGDELLGQARRTSSVAECLQVVRGFYAEMSDEQLDLSAQSRHGLEQVGSALTPN